jgi:transcriptional regulator with XRE-family HTH domain
LPFSWVHLSFDQEGKSMSDKGKKINPRTKNITMEQHIGNRVLLLRHANDLSLKDLAAIIGVTYQQMQKYEKGINRISASTLYELSRYFKISTDFFYEDYRGDHKTEPQLEFTREGMKVASAFNQIPDPIIRNKVLAHILPTIKAFDYYYAEEAIQMRCKEMLERDD